MKYNEKLSQRGDAVTAAARLCFCQAQRLTVAGTGSNVLLSPAQHQDVCKKKVELDPLNLFLKLVLLTKYNTGVTTHTLPPLPPTVRCWSEPLSFYNGSSGCLEKAVMCS